MISMNTLFKVIENIINRIVLALAMVMLVPVALISPKMLFEIMQDTVEKIKDRNDIDLSALMK
jgi:hypothetical protein